MRKLDAYIGRSVGAAILAVLAIILGLDLIFAYLDELKDLGDNYQLAKIAGYLLWTMPSRVYEYLGFAALVGCMVGLGTLASTSELTVIRAAGVPVGRITWAVMKPVLLLIALGLVLVEFVIPHTSQAGEKYKSVALDELHSGGLEEGLWLKEGGEFVHFNAAIPSGELFGITRYRFGDEQELQRVEFAQRGHFDGNHWVLENTRITTFTADRAVSEAAPRGDWPAEISPELFALVVPPPADLSPRNLWSYGNFLDDKGEDSGRYWLEFWKKMLQPLTIATLVMVAVSFIFGPLREVTTGLRVFIGVIVGIVFQILQDMLGPSSLVFGFSPLIAVMVPILLCFGVGWVLLRRAG